MTSTLRRAGRTAILMCAVVSITSVVFAAAQRGGQGAGAKSKTDADAAEYKAYRLSMPVLTKVEAATKAFATTIKNDPNYKALMAAQREHEALENKDDKTPADERRMAELKKTIDANPLGGSSSADQSLDELEAEIAKMPPMANALKANGVSPREYLKFMGVVVQAYVVSASQSGAESKDSGAQLGAALAAGLFGANLAPENVSFVTANRTAVERFMQTMQELGK